MDVEAGEDIDCSLPVKPTSLPLRRSNNKMMDKITGNAQRLMTSSTAEHSNPNGINNTEVSIINETTKGSKMDNLHEMKSGDETCAMFGQIIDNDDETWDLLSNATSWESTFPKEIFSEPNSIGSAIFSDVEDNLPPDWKKICDSSGSYYWNVRTGKTQLHTPLSSDDLDIASMEENTPDEISPTDSNSIRNGHMFIVRSLGWLPMDADSLKPDISSAAVNACIRHLSNNRAQLTDGVGVWGEGKDLMLQIVGDQLKIVDPAKDTLLQTQHIKHIRLWGVGRDNSFDFAYVVRSPSTKLYQCHVFRCDTPAQAIAKQVHLVCAHLVKQKKLSKQNKVLTGNADDFPVAQSEPCREFDAQYVGSVTVDKATGIDVVKDAITSLAKDFDVSNLKRVTVSVSASALTVNDDDNSTIVNCRMRFLSFMGVGDNIEFFGFISVISNQPMCYVLRCEPNAAKLAVAVQEACMLRYQKALDSKQCQSPNAEPKRSKSFKAKIAKLFSGRRTSGS